MSIANHEQEASRRAFQMESLARERESMGGILHSPYDEARMLRQHLIAELVRTRTTASADELIAEAEKLFGYIKDGKPT